MIIAILDYSDGTVGIVDIGDTGPETYIYEHLELKESETEWMEVKRIDMNIGVNNESKDI
jgi:hypothetical protein